LRLPVIGAATVAALLGPVAFAQSGEHPCRSALQQLMCDWDAIGFSAPAKPGQAHVWGRYGHDATGGQVIYMQTQIRHAFQDCDKGDDEAVRQRIASVRNLLAATQSHHSG
jgi:hypothetical protein